MRAVKWVDEVIPDTPYCITPEFLDTLITLPRSTTVSFSCFYCLVALVAPHRLALVRAVKWVDEVIPDTPYCITPEFLDTLFTQHRIDYVVHGDDPCLLPDGTDAYASAKAVGKYKEFKRTEGVSSTDILGACCHSLGT